MFAVFEHLSRLASSKLYKILLSLSQFAVRSLVAIKREESHQWVNCAILQFRKEIILSVCLYRIVDLDTEANIGTKKRVSKFEIGRFCLKYV